MSAASTVSQPAKALPVLLAGLEAGMVGALWMLAWLGLSSVWQRRSFWGPENLMATAFHRDADIAAGFGAGTVSGLALYLLIYSLLGALFAIAMRDRLRPFRLLLGGVAFAVAWYYISFGWIWNKVMPTVASLHVVQATVLGHVIYGTALGRYPLYLSRLEGRQAAVEGEFATEAAVPVVEHVASDPIDGGTQAPPVE